MDVYKKFDLLCAHSPSPKVNNYRSFLGVFCTVAFLFFLGVFMYSSIYGYIFNPPSLEAEQADHHMPIAMALPTYLPVVGFEIIKGGTGEVPLAFQFDQVSNTVENTGTTTTITESKKDISESAKAACKIMSNDEVQQILPGNRQVDGESLCFPVSYELLGGFEDNGHKRVRMSVSSSQVDLDDLWSKSLRLVVKDTNPFRTNNSIYEMEIKFVQNTVVHVDMSCNLNKVVRPSRYLPTNVTNTYATYKTYLTQYSSLRLHNAATKSRTVMTMDILLDFEVFTETQRYLDLLTMLADWGCMGMFLMGLFGIPAYGYNVLRFTSQLKGVDMRQITNDQFNTHGGLSAPNIRLPDEVMGYNEADTDGLSILSPEDAQRTAREKETPNQKKIDFDNAQ